MNVTCQETAIVLSQLISWLSTIEVMELVHTIIILICVCVHACACVHACVRACVRACVCIYSPSWLKLVLSMMMYNFYFFDGRASTGWQ